MWVQSVSQAEWGLSHNYHFELQVRPFLLEE